MLPSEVMVVDRVPILGSGKVDNVAVAGLLAARSSEDGGDDAASNRDPSRDIAAIGPQAAVGVAAAG
jgi:hypothetical protein